MIRYGIIILDAAKGVIWIQELNLPVIRKNKQKQFMFVSKKWFWRFLRSRKSWLAGCTTFLMHNTHWLVDCAVLSLVILIHFIYRVIFLSIYGLTIQILYFLSRWQARKKSHQAITFFQEITFLLKLIIYVPILTQIYFHSRVKDVIRLSWMGKADIVGRNFIEFPP